jgi:opacity protein-like surface antigen
MTLSATLPWAPSAAAQQALPAASRTLQLSAFAGASGVYTGLSNGRNFSITAGADLGLPIYRFLRPTLEVRGTYPIDGGQVDSQESILAGVKVDFLLNRRIHPYGDFLFGRGEMDYNHGGYPFENALYALTTTNVLSPGAGFDYDMTRHLSLRVDGQFQRWGEAPTLSGSVYSKVATVGVVYRFTFDKRHKR